MRLGSAWHTVVAAVSVSGIVFEMVGRLTNNPGNAFVDVTLRLRSAMDGFNVEFSLALRLDLLTTVGSLDDGLFVGLFPSASSDSHHWLTDLAAK